VAIACTLAVSLQALIASSTALIVFESVPSSLSPTTPPVRAARAGGLQLLARWRGRGAFARGERRCNARAYVRTPSFTSMETGGRMLQWGPLPARRDTEHTLGARLAFYDSRSASDDGP
jgi:hypothetical protein